MQITWSSCEPFENEGILRRFAPVFSLHRRERDRPTDLDHYVRQCEAVGMGHEIILDKGVVNWAALGRLSRQKKIFLLPDEDYLDNDVKATPVRVYGCARRLEDGRVCLAYIVFFAVQKPARSVLWGSCRRGEWFCNLEIVHFIVDAKLTAIQSAFFGRQQTARPEDHDPLQDPVVWEPGATWVPTTRLHKTTDGRPVVYVSWSTHRLYWSPGRKWRKWCTHAPDVCADDGVRIDSRGYLVHLRHNDPRLKYRGFMAPFGVLGLGAPGRLDTPGIRHHEIETVRRRRICGF